MERVQTDVYRTHYYDLAERDTDEIWKDLESRDREIGNGNWRPYYASIISKYRVFSRFALMRLAFERETGLPQSRITPKDLERGFTAPGMGPFPRITMDHAKALTEEELEQYQQLFLSYVSRHDPDLVSQAKALVGQALELPKAGEKCRLSREELIRLGHLVDFSLEDMEFLLLRSLGDNEAGFRYGSSQDLIDLYGFLTHARLGEVEALKAWYEAGPGQEEKVSYQEKSPHFSQALAESLAQTFTGWQPETRTRQFKAWLTQQAPTLDIPSKSARLVYCNLAAYAWAVVRGVGQEGRRDFYRDMVQISRLTRESDYVAELFYEQGAFSPDKCRAAADTLIYENAEYAGDFHSHDQDSQSFYHVPYVEKGAVTARGKLNKDSRDRMLRLLLDQESPTKSDLLYLLWLVANFYWLRPERPSRVEFLDDFLASAACLLESASLPEFYPPNVLEETLLTALVLGDEERVPATVYETICASFTQKGKQLKPKGAKRKSKEEKRDIAAYFFDHVGEYPTKTEAYEDCARRFGVGRASVENYCRDYQNGKLE